MEGPEITFAETVIDNGKFGTRTIRFETGRLAQQAQGSAVAYIDEETMLLSATSVSKQPKEHFDFFPLTIDVEERMYAAGRIPGSFFRREGRPSTEAILTCRLIDRPLRPSFVEGLRNEVQVVVTVLAIEPDEFYDVLAINAASLSTQLSGLPFSGPVGGVRVALIDGQWVAFPKYSQIEDAVFSMVVAGRVVTEADGSQDVAIMMIEAEATDNAWNLIQAGGVKPDETVIAQGIEASKPFIKQLVEAQQKVASTAAKPTADYPTFPPYQAETYDVVAGVRATKSSRASTRSPRRSPVKTPTTRSSRASRSTSPRRSRRASCPSRRTPRSRPPTSRSRSSSCARASSKRACASTAAASPTSARSTPRCRSCPACTARPSSSAARPRSWVSPR